MIEHRYEVQVLEDANRYKKNAPKEWQWSFWFAFDDKESAFRSKRGILRSGGFKDARVVFASRLTIHKVID